MLRTCSKKQCVQPQNIWEFRPGRGEGTVKKQYAFKDAFDNHDKETIYKGTSSGTQTLRERRLIASPRWLFVYMVWCKLTLFS